MVTHSDETAVQQRFATGPTPEVEVRTVSGRVLIEAWDRPEVDVSARSAGAPPLVEHVGGRVRVQAPPPGAPGLGLLDRLLSFASVPVADVAIRAPADARVRIGTVSAEVEVKGFRRGARVRTVSGEVDLEDVAGPISLITVSGDLELSRVRGELEVRTVSGDLEVASATLRSADASTASGDLDLEADLPGPGPYRVNTMSGDLHLRVPDGAGLDVAVRTMSGDVDCRLPHTTVPGGPRERRLRVGAGGPALEFQAVSGDLLVEGGAAIAPAPAPTWPEDAPAAPEREDPRLEVLRAIERGDLTVDEGLARLEELDRAEGGPAGPGREGTTGREPAGF